jgi:hypothetical protein
VNQVGPKDSESLNLSFLALKGEAVGVPQISSYNGNGARQTDFFLSLKSCYLAIKSPKVKISRFFFSFFPSLNQYFPHIPYVASKK